MPDVRPGGHLRLAGPYTRDDGERILKSDSSADLLDLRGAIIEAISHIDDQVAKSGDGTDLTEWRSRARAAQHAYRVWLQRISARLADFSGERPRSAVVLKGVGTTSQRTAAALNQLLARGCRIFAFSVIGTDVVVIATEPKGA